MMSAAAAEAIRRQSGRRSPKRRSGSRPAGRRRLFAAWLKSDLGSPEAASALTQTEGVGI